MSQVGHVLAMLRTIFIPFVDSPYRLGLRGFFGLGVFFVFSFSPVPSSVSTSMGHH